jgi:hypothetical protein
LSCIPNTNFFSKKILLQWAILIDLSPKTFSIQPHPPPQNRNNMFLHYFTQTHKTICVIILHLYLHYLIWHKINLQDFTLTHSMFYIYIYTNINKPYTLSPSVILSHIYMHNTGINSNQNAPGIWISPTLTNFKEEMRSNQNPLYFCSPWTLPSVNPAVQLNCHVLLNGVSPVFKVNKWLCLPSKFNVQNQCPQDCPEHFDSSWAMVLGGASQKDLLLYIHSHS